ncbi:MFS transporter [Providencia stuartii]|uniref:Transporter, major facilitator family protein n=1 Tax=Providencia stuartii ATCC 25827 TaxID=471874 RepID=A0AA87CP24_PROST|nr:MULTISPECIES: cyanate transporter [Providencia]EDU57542.1 transporter, major facilitator family protein [Providencia stuartii ATCC 25827]MBS7783677.1 cyanate transporter [Providencia thailandensis]MTC82614.1 MFS transporter [Providencia stuartii]MTC94980.1 MFS transporter [Providencia stuartii]
MAGHKTASLGLVMTIVLVGINLRPFITGPGPLIEGIIQTTGMTYQSISLLTLLPMLLMGVGALIVPALNQRLGERVGLSLAMLLLLIGSLSRLFVTNGEQLLITAFICGVGAAYIQAVFPGLIKLRFPQKMAAMTGLYSAMLMAGGAMGAQLTPMLANISCNEMAQSCTTASGHWQIALAWMALPALFALIAVVVNIDSSATHQNHGRGSVFVFLAKPRAWLLMVGFGLVNAGYGTVVTWLAPFFIEQGMSSADSGSLVALLSVFQALSALLIPILASHNIDRRFWLIVTLCSQMIGFTGLVFFPQLFAFLWVCLIGIGLGGCFALSIIASLDHLPHPVSAGALTSLMQAGGFIIAAFWPLFAAWLHEVSQSFALVWIAHILMILITLLLFLRLNPKHYARLFNLK